MTSTLQSIIWSRIGSDLAVSLLLLLLLTSIRVVKILFLFRRTVLVPLHETMPLFAVPGQHREGSSLMDPDTQHFLSQKQRKFRSFMVFNPFQEILKAVSITIFFAYFVSLWCIYSPLKGHLPDNLYVLVCP